MLTQARFELAPLGLDSSKDRAVGQYQKGVSSNHAQVNIFQSTSTVSDHHEKFLFMYISEDDSV